jgi:hypothetical protein
MNQVPDDTRLQTADAARLGLRRQLAHWSLASERLGRVDELGSAAAWSELDTGVRLRRSLDGAVERLRAEVGRAESAIERGTTARAERAVQRLRRAYLRTETTLDYFGDAIATRSSPRTAALLRAADSLAGESMRRVLEPLGRPTPPVLTYLDKGIGASILKAGLRLWDGGVDNPVAVIKIVRHNLLRPTSLIHEAGHQVAHILAWNEELAEAYRGAFSGALGRTFARWSSEIAADAFAFVHAGYASVAALHDVLDGGPRTVFGHDLVHPIGAVRVVRPLIRHSLPRLHELAAVTLEQPRRAFGGAALTSIVDPGAVAPRELARLERRAGLALERSSHWLRSEGLRLVALTGYRLATSPGRDTGYQVRYLGWMLRLGDLRAVA